jgi:hypothetical protein
MWNAIVRKVLAWLIAQASFKLYTSDTPIGTRLGGHDDTTLPDRYIILDIDLGTWHALLGYWQSA